MKLANRLAATLESAWDFLTRPSASVNGNITRRQARSLASILLVLTAVEAGGLLLPVAKKSEDLPILVSLLLLLVLLLLIPALQYEAMYIPIVFSGASALITLLIRRQFVAVENDRVEALEQERGSPEKAVARRTEELSLRNEELTRRMRLHRELLEAANSLLINLDVDVLLQELAEAARSVLRVRLVVINMVEDGGEEIRMAAHVGLPMEACEALATSGIRMTWPDFHHLLDERYR